MRYSENGVSQSLPGKGLVSLCLACYTPRWTVSFPGESLYHTSFQCLVCPKWFIEWGGQTSRSPSVSFQVDPFSVGIIRSHQQPQNYQLVKEQIQGEWQNRVKPQIIFNTLDYLKSSYLHAIDIITPNYSSPLVKAHFLRAFTQPPYIKASSFHSMYMNVIHFPFFEAQEVKTSPFHFVPWCCLSAAWFTIFLPFLLWFVCVLHSGGRVDG